MNDDEKTAAVYNITSYKPVIYIFICFLIIPSVCIYIFGISISDEQGVILTGLYELSLAAYAALVLKRMKGFLRNFFPDEYAELYGTGSFFTVVRPLPMPIPFVNTHMYMRVEKVLDNSDDYDPVLTELYMEIREVFSPVFYMFSFGGFILFAVLYVIIA